MADTTAPFAAAVASPEEGFGPIRPGVGTTAPPLRRQVYDTVRSHGVLSRLDVAKHLGVSPATVTSAVSELLATGLLVEVDGGARTPGRGRPPVALAVDPGIGYVAGIKLSNPVSTAVLTDFAGQPLASVTLPAARTVRSLEGLLDEAAELLAQLMARAGQSADSLLSIGLGLPGTVDYTAGEVLWSPILSTGSVALRRLASDRLGIQVEIDNDANLVTLAELWFGAGRKLPDFAVVTIEHGVGMGLVIDHQLYRGANRRGLELGHTTVQLDGALCRCGQRGCLEAYVSDYALAREAATVLGQTAPDIASHLGMLELLHDRARDGDAAARAVFARAGRYLALALANVISLYDPSTIIVSGARLQFDFLYADNVLSEIGRQKIYAGRVPRLDVNAWGDLVWARGAATLALDVATDRLTGAA
ncbi:MAG: ROK family transcriptional regulator [Paracoccaceae bacterium]|nr:ROK family transcriptional regulator [Paracoccaceae bacterium]